MHALRCCFSQILLDRGSKALRGTGSSASSITGAGPVDAAVGVLCFQPPCCLSCTCSPMGCSTLCGGLASLMSPAPLTGTRAPSAAAAVQPQPGVLLAALERPGSLGLPLAALAALWHTCLLVAPVSFTWIDLIQRHGLVYNDRTTNLRAGRHVCLSLYALVQGSVLDRVRRTHAWAQGARPVRYLDPEGAWLQTEVLATWTTLLWDVTLCGSHAAPSPAPTAGEADADEAAALGAHDCLVALQASAHVLQAVHGAVTWVVESAAGATGATAAAAVPSVAADAAASAAPSVVAPLVATPKPAVQSTLGSFDLLGTVWRALCSSPKGVPTVPTTLSRPVLMEASMRLRFPLWLTTLQALLTALRGCDGLPPHSTVAPVWYRRALGKSSRPPAEVRMPPIATSFFVRWEVVKVRSLPSHGSTLPGNPLPLACLRCSHV